MENKLHPNVLAQKIVDFINGSIDENNFKYGIKSEFNTASLLKAIPELYAPMAMADQLVLNYEDARMALDNEWDRSDSGFISLKDNCASLYQEWTGLQIKDAVEELTFEDDSTASLMELEQE